jgi:hypothetical protein
MPKKRNNNTTPISLFSFQDIITSVTGIMILIVLLLILSILDKKLTDTPAEKIVDKDHLEKVNILNKIKKIKQKLKEKQQVLQELEDISSPAESYSLGELVQIEQDAIKQNRRRKRELSETKKQLIEQTKNLKILATKNQKVIKLKKITLHDNSRNVQALKEEIEQYKKKTAKIKNQNGTVSFTVTTASNKNPILVQCSEQGLNINQIKQHKIIHITDESFNFIGLLKKFDKWLTTLDNEKDYLVLLIKPSAAGYIPDIESKLQMQYIQYGKEPLEEDKNGVK